MSIKRPTSGGQTCNQEATVQRAFHLERMNFLYLSVLIVKTCRSTSLYFPHSCTKHIALYPGYQTHALTITLQKWSHAPWKLSTCIFLGKWFMISKLWWTIRIQICRVLLTHRDSNFIHSKSVQCSCYPQIQVQLMKYLHTSIADCMTAHPNIVVLLFGRCLFPRRLWVPLWGCSLQRYSRWPQNMRKRCAHSRA